MEGWQRAGEMKRLYINVAQYFLFLACPVLKWRYLIEKTIYMYLLVYKFETEPRKQHQW